MILNELRLENLRNIRTLQFEPRSGFNLLTGPNGAGKTSVLEAVFLLSHAYSFRSGRNEVLVRNGADELTVYGRLERGNGEVRLGLSLAGWRWIGRVDGVDTPSLASLLRECAVVCFEPGSHALISGPSDGRRRFLDWAVFHVEPTFADVARRYRTALRQRNQALRDACSDAELSAWDEELSAAAEPLAAQRQRYFERLEPLLRTLLSRYLADLGTVRAEMRAGWSGTSALVDVLRQQRTVDRARGHTTRGPHRADWSLHFPLAPRREQLSRGQEKLCAIACTVAQAQLYRSDHGEWPIVVLDDLPSELDAAHQQETLQSLQPVSQVFISSTSVPEALALAGVDYARFHVEQGTLRSLL